MKAYLAVFSLVAITCGVAIFTWVFLRDIGMTFPEYKSSLTALLSLTCLISNAALGYYFRKKP
jgi:hypothetical protein